VAELKVSHATFDVERIFPHPAERIFAAFADPAIKARWFAGPGDWIKLDSSFDFRVGGVESLKGGHPGGAVHDFRATYQDIVPNRRILFTSVMTMDDVRISVSVTTTEMTPTATGTHLKMTEQTAFLDAFDDIAGRKKGSTDLLDALGAELDRR
jgi:uncharacterized protein YndB with AHSA1/START domain